MWSKCTLWPDYLIYVVDVELLSSLANYCIAKVLDDCVVELKPFYTRVVNTSTKLALAFALALTAMPRERNT